MGPVVALVVVMVGQLMGQHVVGVNSSCGSCQDAACRWGGGRQLGMGVVGVMGVVSP